MRQTTIFRQLIYNIVFPVVFALFILGVINFRSTRNILKESNEERNFLITDEITQVLKFQDISLAILEENLNPKLERISNSLINEYFVNTKDIDKIDLLKVRKELGLEKGLYDLYIIDTNGVVVNTTFTEDLGLHFFEFGEVHENLLRGILRDGEYVSERFTIENKTRRLKKYTYQPTNDGLYIVELGIYSSSADDVINKIKDILNKFSEKQKSIISAELFMNEDDPFSLTKNVELPLDEAELIKRRFIAKDTLSMEGRENGKLLSRQYFYMNQNDSELYTGSVVRVISDRTDEVNKMYFSLLSYILIFILIMLTIIVLIYQKTRLITNPIKNLVDHVNRISHGNLSERADVVGNNEITTLSKKFNVMIEQLEESYNDLDLKVKQRTAEVVAQKEELEAQKDELERQTDQLLEQQKHIMDSIHYAKRLQTAILPTNKYVKELFPESFVLFYPKDIVSGDFYWVFLRGNKKYFAAIDCTGHGVPGALVSMVGNNWLEHAMRELKLEAPADILTALNDGVTTTFKEKDDETSVKDGMDLALCCIDYDKMELQYAGAYNPLIIIQDGELIQIKGDKFPIGAFSRRREREFANHTMKIKKGDMIYVFSDGYSDQFGGVDSRKFLFKNLKNQFMEIYDKPVLDQLAQLENTLFDWMGTEDQLDDILVIGVKV